MKKSYLLIILSILFFGSMKAQDNYYTPAGAYGTNAFAVWADVLIDGEVQTSSDIEVAMFYDDVCVKTQRIKSYFNGGIPAAVNLSFSADAGKAVTFKLYNHADSEEMVNCTFSTTTPDHDTVIGAPGDRIGLEFLHTYEIAASANLTEGGSVTGAGSYDHGTSVTLTATPNEGYNFINWTENGEEVSTEAEYIFTATASRTLVANFEEAPYGPAYPWTVNPNAYNGNGFIVALVQINGVTITDGTNWEVGAFNGDHCNGVGNIDNDSWVSGDSETPYEYYLMMMLYGNGGETLNFYLYNREEEEVLEAECNVTVTYQNDCEFGNFDEPYVLNFVTVETHTKDIIGYGNSNNGRYYLIASPIGEVSPTEVGNMFKYDYDLYYFEQNPSDGLEWINIKDGNTNLVPGKGYLYASQQDVTLTFYGPGFDGSGDVTLVKNAPDNLVFEGWNLVGNPFAQTAYINKPYYTTNPEGTEIISVTGNSVEPMEGVFVIADNHEEVMTFTTEEPAKSISQIALNVTHNRGNVIDRAIICFGESGQLPKFQLNPNSTKVYIPQNDKDYAVVSAEAQGEMPVSFRAAKNGSYTFNLSSENVDFAYLHLIDNMTGADVDLLQTPSYTFEAKTTDYASRFKLVFATGDADEDNFVFNSNGTWVINNDGQAILQVLDVMGRILKCEQIEGCHSLNFNAAPGVYMFSLTKGNDVKVQKVVVK